MFHAAIRAWFVPRSSDLPPERGEIQLHDAVGVNCKNGGTIDIIIIIVIIVFNLIALANQSKAKESEESKFHSVWLKKKWNSFTIIFSNTCAWEQQA